MRLYYSIIDSPVGPLLLGKSDAGLAWLGFQGRGAGNGAKQFANASSGDPRNAEAFCGGRFPGGRFAKAEWIASDSELKDWTRQLKEYFAGNRRDFDAPVDLHGTEFQVRCWRELLKIPYGETISYAELSARVGSKNGFRAVGAANGANPVAIVVPCHRVVASDRTLGGYGGGLSAKELLLKLEGAWPPRFANHELF